ncbi:MAG: hypothetical protein IJH64_01645 [Oscillospiraceae bacterium]|nr:hypothetical protein [Oscillospiraceae bacterium]
MTVKQLKRGEWFTLKPIENPTESQVYIRGDYIRETKRYECQLFDDISAFRYFKGDKEVFTEFTF